MKSGIKIVLAVLYCSSGVIYGLIVLNLPKLVETGSFMQQWGVIMLMASSVVCPFGVLAFGWNKTTTTKSDLAWTFIILILVMAFWFFVSAVATVWIGTGGDG